MSSAFPLDLSLWNVDVLYFKEGYDDSEVDYVSSYVITHESGVPTQECNEISALIKNMHVVYADDSAQVRRLFATSGYGDSVRAIVQIHPFMNRLPLDMCRATSPITVAVDGERSLLVSEWTFAKRYAKVMIKDPNFLTTDGLHDLQGQIGLLLTPQEITKMIRVLTSVLEENGLHNSAEHVWKPILDKLMQDRLELAGNDYTSLISRY